MPFYTRSARNHASTKLLRRLLGIAVGMSAMTSAADEIPPPPTGEQSSRPIIVSHSGDFCIPEFSAPAAAPTQSFLNAAAPIAPTVPSATPQSYNFGGGLAGNTLLASSYTPAMIGDYFGGSSSSGMSMLAAHLHADLGIGTLVTPFDPLSNDPYSGTVTGTLFIDGVNSPLPTPLPSETITNFSGTYTTQESQSAIGYDNRAEIASAPQVQAAVVALASQAYGNGYAVIVPYSQLDHGQGATFYDNGTGDFATDWDYYTTIITPGGTIAAAPGANIGRQKLSENTSPIPRDRVFINYNYFNSTPLARGGVDVNRVTPGFEKTFFNGRMSFEMRTPFATTLDNTVDINGLTNSRDTEFGNLTMYLKGLLLRTETLAFSTGLGVAAPTAKDFAFTDGTTQIVRVENESVHLLPFFATLWTPNERLFAQSMIQYDIDANGNPVSVSGFDGTDFTGDMTRIGRPYDYTYMYLDFNVGYWTYLAPNSGRLITGIAPMMEIHVNQTVGAASATRQVVDNVPWQFTSPSSLNSVNATVGANMILRDRATLTLGYGTPLGGVDQFDGEFRLSFNWLFGNSRPLNPLTRTNTF